MMPKEKKAFSHGRHKPFGTVRASPAQDLNMVSFYGVPKDELTADLLFEAVRNGQCLQIGMRPEFEHRRDILPGRGYIYDGEVIERWRDPVAWTECRSMSGFRIFKPRDEGTVEGSLSRVWKMTINDKHPSSKLRMVCYFTPDPESRAIVPVPINMVSPNAVSGIEANSMQRDPPHSTPNHHPQHSTIDEPYGRTSLELGDFLHPKQEHPPPEYIGLSDLNIDFRNQTLEYDNPAHHNSQHHTSSNYSNNHQVPQSINDCVTPHNGPTMSRQTIQHQGEAPWFPGVYPDQVWTPARVGINTDCPTEALVVHGNMTVTGNLLQPSDARVKENVKEVDAKSQLDNIKAIKLYNYDFKKEWKDTTGAPDADVGVIAQELETVIPAAVVKSGPVKLQDGTVIQDLRTVNKDRLFMENVGAVQALAKASDNLNSRVTMLEVGGKPSDVKEKSKVVSLKRFIKERRPWLLFFASASVLLVATMIVLLVLLLPGGGSSDGITAEEKVYAACFNTQSENSTLRYLSIDFLTLSPPFDPEIYHYNVRMESLISEVKIRCRPSHPDSIVKAVRWEYASLVNDTYRPASEAQCDRLTPLMTVSVTVPLSQNVTGFVTVKAPSGPLLTYVISLLRSSPPVNSV
eukprot:Colp12_sorted_trinity150504_noHs@1587